jgi:hypothetical protein
MKNEVRIAIKNDQAKVGSLSASSPSPFPKRVFQKKLSIRIFFLQRFSYRIPGYFPYRSSLIYLLFISGHLPFSGKKFFNIIIVLRDDNYIHLPQ